MVVASFFSCKTTAEKKQETWNSRIAAHSEYKADMVSVPLADSGKLIHVSNDFYKSKEGHLYLRNFSTQEVRGIDSPVGIVYFNGAIPQNIDPYTFHVIGDSWYAKDKNAVYFYRPTAGGMFVGKLETADVNTFAVVKGEYLVGTDTQSIYVNGEALQNSNPKSFKIIKDSAGFTIKIISGNRIYEDW